MFVVCHVFFLMYAISVQCTFGFALTSLCKLSVMTSLCLELDHGLRNAALLACNAVFTIFLFQFCFIIDQILTFINT
jgi:hypothetical protein